MARFFAIAAFCVAVSGAPAQPIAPRLYTQHGPSQLQQINPSEYYLENPEVANYYSQAQQKQVSGGVNSSPNGAPSRLETLEPDSEVELIPGAQPPQQPPPQVPVAPNVPGLLPGQRVFIVHMPVPGYRPGTIGGYQPVYIVAAAPQGNNAYPGNGFQNAFLVDPSGQPILSPAGYRPGVAALAQNPPGLVAAPLPLNRPYELVYAGEPAGYQNVPGTQGIEINRGTVRLAQLVGLQAQPLNPAENTRPLEQSPEAPKRLVQSNNKEIEDPRRNPRPSPPQSLTQNPKA